jgi:hypothetical protein
MKKMKNELTTYQIYLILLGYFTDHDDPEMIKSMLTELYKRAEGQDKYLTIKNNILLPKGHGRLKDVDAFISKVDADRKHSAYVKSWTADDVLSALDNSYAPTIIEADKAVSEG